MPGHGGSSPCWRWSNLSSTSCRRRQAAWCRCNSASASPRRHYPGGQSALSAGLLLIGGIGGILSAVIGTYGGLAARERLAAAFRKDRPAALIEDRRGCRGGRRVTAAR